MIEVHVLLSLYRLSPYLEELLFSLLKQEEVTVKLTVRNDGNSQEILTKCLQVFPTASLCSCIDGNVGVNESYLHLLTHVKSEKFIAFCDEDDIWDSRKLIELVKAMRLENKPQISSSRMRILHSKSFVQPKTFRPSKKGSIFENYLAGCNLLINEFAARALLDNPPPSQIHYDDWLTFLVAHFGEVHYTNNVQMSYRVHEFNTIGLPLRNAGLIDKIRELRKSVKFAKKRTAKKIDFILKFPQFDYGEYFDNLREFEPGLGFIGNIRFFIHFGNPFAKRLKLFFYILIKGT
jgi:glycosyltransferase involved in cell wall biosynthesis